jgi:hypothetical protein
MDKLLDVYNVADTLALSPLTVRRYIALGTPWKAGTRGAR